MDKLIDNRFQRVETALATLIQSIAIFNPSTNLANALVTADAELSEGLEILSTHQANYAKIVSLREESSKLDDTIRETMTLLIDTRRSLLNTPATTFPEAPNAIHYAELLSYARRISKTTLPRDRPQVAPTPGSETPPEGKSEAPTNGTNTPMTNGADKDSQAIAIRDSATPSQSQTQTQTSQVAATLILPRDLERSAGEPFTPWPTYDNMRKGALASINILVAQGQDPAKFDPAESEKLEAARQQAAEREDQERKEQERLQAEKMRAEHARRQSAAGPSAAQGRGEPEPKKKFQLETFDDDESD